MVCGVRAAAGRTRRMGRPVMCACEPGFTCSRCEPRRQVDVGEWTQREVEAWRREQELSRHDFEEPFKP